MKTNIHPDLLNKLEQQKTKYRKVTAFAELIPLFSSQIISGEFTGEHYCKLTDRFGKLYCAWGINWYTNTPTNYPQEKHSEVGFVNIYINCHSLFGDDCSSFAREELGKVLPLINVHFYDHWNSNFYFLPFEVEDGLKKLEKWFIDTHSKCAEYLKEKRKADLQRQLQELT